MLTQVVGAFAPYKLQWDGVAVVKVKRTVEEMKEELRRLHSNNVSGWWNKKYDKEKIIMDKLEQLRQKKAG